MGKFGGAFSGRKQIVFTLEALDINRSENMAGNHNLHREKNHHLISPSHIESKKCNDHCIDCFSVFCHK